MKDKNQKKSLRSVKKTRRTFPKVKSQIKAGPTRRAELDHVGSYNFMVEIEGVSAGF